MLIKSNNTDVHTVKHEAHLPRLRPTTALADVECLKAYSKHSADIYETDPDRFPAPDGRHWRASERGSSWIRPAPLPVQTSLALSACTVSYGVFCGVTSWVRPISPPTVFPVRLFVLASRVVSPSSLCSCLPRKQDVINVDGVIWKIYIWLSVVWINIFVSRGERKAAFSRHALHGGPGCLGLTPITPPSRIWPLDALSYG